MTSNHWIAIIVALLIGYFLRPYFPQLGALVGQ